MDFQQNFQEKCGEIDNLDPRSSSIIIKCMKSIRSGRLLGPGQEVSCYALMAGGEYVECKIKAGQTWFGLLLFVGAAPV